jgi:hypothetical protein
MKPSAIALVTIAACTSAVRPFSFRDPLLVDPDTRAVSVPCRPDPDKNDPRRQTCAPREYVSPFVWDQLDNLVFRRLSRALAFATTGQARNANSLDEVADSSWFTNRPKLPPADPAAPGSCTPEDVLPGPDDVAPGTWVIDHGKDNGSSLGFRVDIPGKGKYMLKADDTGKADRASAASVIGSAIYHAIGFNTSCEQVVVIRKEQLRLTAGLKSIDNAGLSHPFDDKALVKVLESTTHLHGGAFRMQASKWLPGLSIGPFRYIGTRDDDPNDVVDHADRRELRGSRLLAAGIDHGDAREQNSMDVWMSDDASNKRASPGHVVHYILDTSDTLGGEVGIDEMSKRLGYAYEFDPATIVRSLFDFGAEEWPWDRAHRTPGKERFGYFGYQEFDPSGWRPFYPNPAFVRMTERDGAWMARKIARFSPDDVRSYVELGKWSDPSDVDYLTRILLERQRKLLERYLSKLSPLGDVHVEGSHRVCATDFARLRSLYAPQIFKYSVFERAEGLDRRLPARVEADGRVCFDVISQPHGPRPDADPHRRIEVSIRNGTGAGPLIVHLFDLEQRGVKLVGLTRRE